MTTITPPKSAASPIAELHPASFAMVMATGIVSVACELRGMSAIAQALLWLNVALYFILWVMYAVRVARFCDRFFADLFDHNRCVGYFTLIAATCVLGNQFVVVANQPRIAVSLWIVGVALWAIITYAIFTILTVKTVKPTLDTGLNGAWLVTVVAAQSVSALGTLVANQLGVARDAALFFSLVMWLGGGMLYIWIIALIFYRYTFFSLEPSQLAPPYWINMGAMAISTLAGTLGVGRPGGRAIVRGRNPLF
jgi:tellurite resistance protein TehA-like permease